MKKGFLKLGVVTALVTMCTCVFAGCDNIKEDMRIFRDDNFPEASNHYVYKDVYIILDSKDGYVLHSGDILEMDGSDNVATKCEKYFMTDDYKAAKNEDCFDEDDYDIVCPKCFPNGIGKE